MCRDGPRYRIRRPPGRGGRTRGGDHHESALKAERFSDEMVQALGAVGLGAQKRGQIISKLLHVLLWFPLPVDAGFTVK